MAHFEDTARQAALQLLLKPQKLSKAPGYSIGGVGDLKTFCLTIVGCKSLLGTKLTAYLFAWNYEFSCLFLFGDFCWDD